MYKELSMAAQAAYAEVLDQRQSIDLQGLAPLSGKFQKKTVKGSTYWYLGYRDIDGRVKTVYVGPDNDRVRTLMDKAAASGVPNEVVTRQASAAIALGCMGLADKHFRIINRLAQYGLFRSGGVLIGTHAFLTLGNMLGVHWAHAAATLDVDFAHAGKNISIALPGDVQFDAKSAIDSLEIGLLPILSLDGKSGAQYRNPADPELRIDFLTCEHRAPGYVRVPNTNLVLEPLKFMEFSLQQGTQGVVMSKNGQSCIATIPSPARFAIHKLIVFGERAPAARVKSQKDLLQAASLICYMKNSGRKQDVSDAWADALSRGKGWRTRAEQGRSALLARFPELADAALWIGL